MQYRVLSLSTLFLIFLASATSGGQDSTKIDQDSSSNSTNESNIKFTENNYPNPF